MSDEWWKDIVRSIDMEKVKARAWRSTLRALRSKRTWRRALREARQADRFGVGPGRDARNGEWSLSGPGVFRWKRRTDFGARIKTVIFAYGWQRKDADGNTHGAESRPHAVTCGCDICAQRAKKWAEEWQRDVLEHPLFTGDAAKPTA